MSFAERSFRMVTPIIDSGFGEYYNILSARTYKYLYRTLWHKCGDSDVGKNKWKVARNKPPLGKIYVCSHCKLLLPAFACTNANVTFRPRLISNSITERTLHYVGRILQRDRMRKAFIAFKEDTWKRTVDNHFNAFKRTYSNKETVIRRSYTRALHYT